MEKQAFLIIAHNNFEILEKIVKLLDNENVDIFIHIDKKTSIDNIEQLKNILYSNINIYQKINVNWGGSSQIDVELFLLEKAIQYAEKNQIQYSYFHLISGVDMPIKPIKEIINFFEQNKGKEFIHFYAKELNDTVIDRFKYYHFLEENKWKRNKFGKHIYKVINKILMIMQKIIRINRTKKNKIYQYGCNWFSITIDFAKYVLEKKDIIKKEYKYTYCCDEIFIQTLLINSEFKENLYLPTYDNNYAQCQRYIDWTRGNPYTFRKEDFEDLMKSNYMFARKFDYKLDSEIIEKIYYELR